MNGHGPREGAFAPLRHAGFRTLWLATVVANTGYWAQAAGLAWWLVNELQPPSIVVLAHTATTAPILLLSYVAGILADRFGRLKVQYVAQIAALFAAIALAALACSDVRGVGSMLSLAAVHGVAAAIRGPAWQASIGDTLPDRLIAAGTTLSSLGFNLSRVVGPLLGGALIVPFGVEAPFAFNAIAAAILWRTLIHLQRQPHTSARGQAGATPGGLRYLWTSPSLVVVYARALSTGLPASAILALLPVLAAEFSLCDPVAYTVLLGAFGAGGAVSALMLPRLRTCCAVDTLLGWAVALLAAGMIVLAGQPADGVGAVASGMAGSAWLILFSTLNAQVQLGAPSSHRGRAVAMYMTLAFGGMAIGGVLWGQLADAVGPGHSLRLAAGLMLAGSWLARRLFGPLSGHPSQQAWNADRMP